MLDQIEERLVGVEDIFVDIQQRPADPPVLQSAHQLAKEANVRAEVEVSVEEVSLSQKALGPGVVPKSKLL